MTMTIGYDKPLYVLPFDHRATFSKTMFGWQGPLSPEQTAAIASVKQVIYDAFRAAVAGGIPKERAGILVDEQFGAAILRDASKQGFITACPAEKSGQDEFDFEYGPDFARHIDEFNPTFCKVLVRYNPKRNEDCHRVVAAARRGGRESVGCIVLGRGEDDTKVRQWLTTAAGVPGFIGFAVGRTTFWDPLVSYRADTIAREGAVAQIAASFR